MRDEAYPKGGGTSGPLRSARKKAVEGAQQALAIKYKDKKLSPGFLEREIERLEREGERLPAFSGAIVCWLRRRLQRK